MYHLEISGLIFVLGLQEHKLLGWAADDGGRVMSIAAGRVPQGPCSVGEKRPCGCFTCGDYRAHNGAGHN